MKIIASLILVSVFILKAFPQSEIIVRKNVINATINWGSKMLDIRSEYERVITNKTTISFFFENYNSRLKYNFIDSYHNYAANDQMEKYMNIGFLFRRYFLSGKRYFPKGCYFVIGPNTTLYKAYEKDQLSSKVFSIHFLCGSGFQFLIKKRISLNLLMGYNLKLFNSKKVYFEPQNTLSNKVNQNHFVIVPSIGIAF